MASLRLCIDGSTFRDAQNREVILRGINIDATAKFPKTPNLPSYIAEGFYDGDNVSFVGRPFALEDAHTHFERLRRWGYNQVRYIFTWEAIEHSGPGKYDEEWIAFTIDMLQILKKFAFYVYMDPHQDVWSRFSGGSGAPMWTVYAAGFDPRNFNVTQAALVQNTYPNPASFPKMIWSTNYTRLVCQTIFTLFWAGRDFAPKAIINGKNIQDFLQDHFIAAVRHLAKRIHEAGGLENEVVIGWESINEPNRGLVGVQNISVIPPEQQLQLGTSPTAFQGMLLGSGRPCEITTWAFGSFGPRQIGRELVDPKGATAWLSAEHDIKYGWRRDPQWKLGECLWAQHGVWDVATDTLLKKDYFAKDPKTGEKLDYNDFTNQYFLEHYRKYRNAIRSVHEDAILFCQPPVMEVPPSVKGTLDDDPNMVHSIHFYDGLTLMTKHWNRFYNVDVIGVLRGKYLTPAFAVKIGETAIRNCLRDQLHFLRQESLDLMGDHPAILTETGIPYDMDDKHAYKTGDYSSQVSAMDANHFAIEGSGMNGFSLWTYMATNIHEWGDHWNGEDLSIYSLDDLELPTAKSQLNSLNQSSTSLDRTSPAFSQSRTDSLSARIEPKNLQQALAKPCISTKATSNPELRNHAGYRAAEAYIRPSPVVIHGSLANYGFDLRNCSFTMSLSSPTATPENAPTVVYLPEFHYPSMHTDVTVSGGKWIIDKQEVGSGIVQHLKWWHAEGDQTIEIRGAKRKAGTIVDIDDDEAYLEQCKQNACILM
ncbi:endo-1,4-beta-glucanase [Emydomyces testavorans]|uniref:Endo-1,4-beta-glucanase n=1 Tax=Emydomyces testavorans TaxID=2070801 RepID=A0AAF0IKP1_9EURO|nr:endo-1,4-beta-glucanase [Emydomyces testavorans]